MNLAKKPTNTTEHTPQKLNSGNYGIAAWTWEMQNHQWENQNSGGNAIYCTVNVTGTVLENFQRQLSSMTTSVPWANKEHVTETTSPQKKTKPQKQPEMHPKENWQMQKEQSVRTPSWPRPKGGSDPPGTSPICRVGSWQAEPGSLTIWGNVQNGPSGINLRPS
jgi:hypothetical protein